jgi:hypothetical protein
MTASAALNKARREQLCGELALRLDPITEVRRIGAFLDAERIDVHAVREIISAERTRSILGTLAPVAFGRACGLVAELADAVPDQCAVSAAQAALAEAVAAADAKIAAAARSITAGAIEQAAIELDYAVSVHQRPSATEMELRRGHQVVRLRIHHGAEAASEHAGPSDVTCRQWQFDLGRAVERQGIILAKCHQYHHDAGGPAPTGAYGDSSTVCVTVLSTDRDATSTSARRVDRRGAHAASSHQGSGQAIVTDRPPFSPPGSAANPRKEGSDERP